MLHFKANAIVITVGWSMSFGCLQATLATPTPDSLKQTQDDAKPSQTQCLEAVGKFLKGASLNAVESDQAFALIKRCQDTFWMLPDPNAPLPTVTQCINFNSLMLDAFRQNRIDKLTEITAEQQRSLLRCREVIESRYMPSGSMLPTLQINDSLFIDKSAYQSQSPQRGDIILFQPTEVLRKQNFKDAFTKRIIGLPGDKVEVRNSAVYINETRLQENYISAAPQYQYGAVIVPADQYFVLGDNRNNSYDSHYWGFVPRSLIIGKAFSIYCPIKRQQLLSNSDNLSDGKRTAMTMLFKSIAPVCASIAKNQNASSSQTNAYELAAKRFVGLMNRWQQASYLEKNRFTSNLAQLSLKSPSGIYNYSIRVVNQTRMVQNFGLAKKNQDSKAILASPQ